MEKDDVDPQHMYSDTDTEEGTESENSENAEAVVRVTRYTRKAGPIRRARKTVAFIRKSGQRRDELQRIITDGNTQSLWKEVTVGDDGKAVETPVNFAFSNLHDNYLTCYSRSLWPP